MTSSSLVSSRRIDSASVVVHNFSDKPSDTAALLAVGRAVIRFAISPVGWVTVVPRSYASISLAQHVQSYDFFLRPPNVSVLDEQSSGQESIKTCELQEWGSPLDPTVEVVSDLENLQEFASTDFNHIPSSQRRLSAGTTQHYSVESWLTDELTTPYNGSLEHPSKRRRIDRPSLYNLIPQPHYHPSPVSDMPLSIPNEIAPYSKCVPTPISPYTAADAAEFIETPYARSAWIIPIRGEAPWEGCSSAIVTETYPGLSSSTIHWTHLSLPNFWEFLLSLRNAKTLGPISVSFHASPTSVSTSPTSDKNLTHMDHFKIYHDARLTLHLRNVLDAWMYSEDSSRLSNSKDESADKAHCSSKPEAKIRVLKGSKFALVNERSQGVMVL